MEEPTDTISALIAAGDRRAAVTECARVHGRSIGRLCMAMLGNASDADEVLQETLLAAHRGMESFRGEGTVRAWLFGIARRQCARHLEARRNRAGHLQVVPEQTPSDDDPEDAARIAQRARIVRAALEHLKPSERDALLLRYQADLSFREIADACGIDEAAARKRASRGLSRLRNLLTREDVE
jgi:RNA polymerase sigma-70 factor (ECF subfamily)